MVRAVLAGLSPRHETDRLSALPLLMEAVGIVLLCYVGSWVAESFAFP